MTVHAASSTEHAAILRTGMALFAVACAIVLCWDGIVATSEAWLREEYSYGWFVPLIAAYFLWRSGALQSDHSSRTIPALLLLASSAVAVVGELAAIFVIIQYAVIIMLAAIFGCLFGYRAMMRGWTAWVLLFFAVPLPNFFYFNLSQVLQLISSELGVAIVRLFGVAVHLEGNVIDLGSYKLQVVDACSGLRYLFPLATFGFIVATLIDARPWQKALIFLSTLPITVLMNSLRIGLVGIIVDAYGISSAEGFQHFFEGWVIFVGCLAILLIEVWLLQRFSGSSSKSVTDSLEFETAHMAQPIHLPSEGRTATMAIAMSAVAAMTLFTLGIADREEKIPARKATLLQFPLSQGAWMGRESALEPNVVETLQVSDYLMANYERSPVEPPVNLYIAYYESQRKGASVHSPRACMPAGGWVMSDLQEHTLQFAGLSSTTPFRVQRVLISKGNQKQLVYYWFQQRHRHLTNQYLVKWFLFWDSLTRQRTDGALIRLVTTIPPAGDVQSADHRLTDFALDFKDVLPRYVPHE